MPISSSSTTSAKQAWVSFWTLAIRVAGVALQMAMLLLLSHSLTPEAFGVYATAYALLAVVRVVGPLGFDQLALQGLFGHDRALPPLNQLSDAFVLLMIINIGCAIIIGAGMQKLTPEPFATSFAIIAAALPAVSIAGLTASVIRSYNRGMLAQLPESVVLPILAMLLISIGAWVGSITLRWCIVALSISAWLVLFVYIIILKRVTPFTRLVGAPWRAFGLTRIAASFTGALVMTAAASRLPIFLAATLLGPAHVATAEVASRFGTIGTIITSSVASAFSPQFSRAHARTDWEKADQLLRFSSRIAVVSVTLLCLALVIIFHFLPGFVLPEYYANAFAMLLCFCMGTVINAAFGLSSNYLLMAGQPKIVMLLSTTQLIAMIATSLALAQRFGLVGIGISLIIGATIRDGGAWLVVSKSLKGNRK